MRNITDKVNDSAPAASGYLDAAEFNSSQTELENAVTSSPGGLTLDPALGPDSSTNMLAQSIQRHAAGGAIWCTASGTAGAHTVSIADSNVVDPTQLFDGLTCRYDPPANNTGAVTVNAFGLGAKPLVNHVSGTLNSGAIDGRVIDIIYDSSIGSGSWVLPAWSNALYVGQTPSSPPSISDGEGWEVNGSNQGKLNFPGLTGDATPLAADLFAFHDNADGVHKAITYAQLSALLGTGGGLLGVQLVTASGTYTKTTNTTKAIVFATGGGGGGAAPAARDREGGGGGAGATAIAFADLSAVSTVACVIGAGGAGGAAGQSGSDGGQTSFGSYAVAGGGKGGKPWIANWGSNPGGAGGTATTGLMLLGGSGGNAGHYNDGGTGGSSFWGGGGLGGSEKYHPPGHGFAAVAYGAGGGGADQYQGGAGASGCILVLEFA